LKQWIQKLIDQLDYDFKGPKSDGDKKNPKMKISDERATLLYVIDTYSKHLVEVENYPVRRVRDAFDAFSKELLEADKEKLEDSLFRFRQFFMGYKTAEYAFLRKSFEDFKGIVWNFVEQMSEDLENEKAADKVLESSLKDLKDAVEADSMSLLRTKSREFIDVYMTAQARKEERRSKRVRGIKKNLDSVKKQLVEADKAVRQDHLTGAYNRKSFDEHMKEQFQLFQLSKTPVSVLTLDIDFFKKINDTYGHDIGDFILKECVKLLQATFAQESDFVARVGGEEFVIVLSDHNIEQAVKKAEVVMAKIRKEVFVESSHEFRFTVSMGIAQLLEGESVDQLMKRADQALYDSKHGGRNRFTIARTLASAA
jgi:diguanylate cyclase